MYGVSVCRDDGTEGTICDRKMVKVRVVYLVCEALPILKHIVSKLEKTNKQKYFCKMLIYLNFI